MEAEPVDFKKHSITLLTTFILWFLFLLAGLPSDYYQTLSFGSQVWLSIFAFILILPLAYVILRWVWKEDYFKASIWCAFYASVPLVFYDYVYTGLIEGLGFSYLFSHWYLTIFYFIVWIEILPVGFILERGKENE